jgi:aminoglycoside N3'-acetyltransferase
MLKLGRYEEAIRDAENAVKRTKHSILAMEALGKLKELHKELGWATYC